MVIIGAATLKQIMNNRQKTVDKTLGLHGLAKGGIVPQRDPVRYDRGWYKCGKCGRLFEDHIPMQDGKLLRNVKCIFCGNE